MRVRWFGSAWPAEDRRATICEDDQFKVPVEELLDQRCVECGKGFTEKDRGVITACSGSVWHHFWLNITNTDQDVTDGEEGERVQIAVCAYHLFCWLEEVIGGELSDKVAERMRLRPGDRPLTNEEIDEMEGSGLSNGSEDAEIGGGWER